MEYKIIERTTDTIITTIVEYNIDGEIVIVSVPHFNPQDEDVILKGIANRYITEKKALFPSLEEESIQQTNNYANDI